VLVIVPHLLPQRRLHLLFGAHVWQLVWQKQPLMLPQPPACVGERILGEISATVVASHPDCKQVLVPTTAKSSTNLFNCLSTFGSFASKNCSETDGK
jgi:hypothetical protein